MSDLVEQSIAAWSTRIEHWAKPEPEAAPTWRGRPCLQFTSDLWRYAELVWEMRPPFIIETGTAMGGTALFLTDVLRATENGGLFISIDIKQRLRSDHDDLIFISGSSLEPAVVRQVTQIVGNDRGLVLLDGDHASRTVAGELEVYPEMADYLVVQDTIMRWLPNFDDGPYIALDKWLPDHPEFQQDTTTLHGPTQNPGGWLKRVSD